MITDSRTNQRNKHRLLINVAQGHSEEDCWEWRGQISNSGYGRVMLNDGQENKMFSAHRASYELFVAPIRNDGIIKQTCNNRLCVNPAHLEQTTS